ncbi:MAG: LEA14-like dessication related protein [Arenicella sp.]|jgi:LEA14-like dessication related protein
MKNILLFSLLIVIFSSCTSLKAPTFQSIDDLKVSESSLRRVTVVGNMVLNNPNKNKLELDEIDIKMLSNGNELGEFIQNVSTRIDGFKDFSVPFSITFDPAKMGESLLSTAMSAFSNGKLKLNFRGYMRVRGIDKKKGFKIPVIYGKTIKFK